MGVRIIFYGRGLSGTDLWGGDLVGHPLHGQGPGGVSYTCGETSDGTDDREDTGWEVEIHLRGGSKGGGGILDNGGVYQAAEEHGRTVH